MQNDDQSRQRNPASDPCVENGYRGYGLRAIAHRNGFGTFTPSLEIRDFRSDGGGRKLLAKRSFSETECVTADDAMRYAMDQGRHMADSLAESVDSADAGSR